jgi:hypothetical protein
MSVNAKVVQSAEQLAIQPAGGGSTPTPSLQISDYDIRLELVSRGDLRYKAIRDQHYVANAGCIGQQAHFLIHYRGDLVGIISAASPVYAVACRDAFFGINKNNRHQVLNGIVNNVVFRLESREPNLASRVMKLWRNIVSHYWYQAYGVVVYGFETLVAEDGTRNGVLYRADNWTHVGMTEGWSKLRRGINLPADNWQPTATKLVYCRWREGFHAPCAAQVPRWVRENHLVDCLDKTEGNRELWKKDKRGRRARRCYLKRG